MSLFLKKLQINLAKAKLEGAVAIKMSLDDFENIVSYLEAYELKIEAYRDKLSVSQQHIKDLKDLIKATAERR